MHSHLMDIEDVILYECPGSLYSIFAWGYCPFVPLSRRVFKQPYEAWETKLL